MSKLSICTELEDKVRTHENAVRWLQIHDDVGPELMKEADYIAKWITQYLNYMNMQELRKKYPEVDFLKKYYSEEAWTLPDNIKNRIDRIKKFIARTYEYIKNYIAVSITAAGTECKKWGETCKSRHADAENYIKQQEPKGPSVEMYYNVLAQVNQRTKEFNDMLSRVSTLTTSNVGTGDNTEKLIEDPPSQKKWEDAVQAIEAANPKNKETQGARAVSYFDGGWSDPGKIENLTGIMNTVLTQYKAINSTQRNVQKLISDLEVADNKAPQQKTDNDNGKTESQTLDVMNKKKMEFLQRLSTGFLKETLGTLSKHIAGIGEKCTQFNKGMDTNTVKGEAAK